MISKAVADKFELAFNLGDIRVGLEHKANQWSDCCRAVVQFNVGRDLFDLFFNARTGYRAHFRAHYQCGLDFENNLLRALRSLVEAKFPDDLSGRKLDFDFNDCGEVRIQKQFLIHSLAPHLSKIWWCGKLIQSSGGIEQLNSFINEPKILLDGGAMTWRSFYRDDDGAWLDVKGAFVKPNGEVYQPKPPVARAQSLHATGEPDTIIAQHNQ